MTNHELAITVFLQLALLLAFVRIVSRVAVYAGQPPVVGEMIAGFLIGPSLFGRYSPELFQQLFPKPAVSVLYVLSQLGLVLYMFLVGADFDVDLVKRRLRAALGVSLAGILMPFALGALLAQFIWGNTELFSGQASLPEVMFFCGAAMSITAFPMLARIIRERGLSGTSMGSLALAAGSIDDAAAWCILALVVGSFSGTFTTGLIAIGGGVLYLLSCVFLVGPALRRLVPWLMPQGRLHELGFGIILILISLGAWFTDKVGIYAVFGAFIMGAVMPRGALIRQLSERLEPLAKNLLLPLFFIYSGLNMRLDLLIQPSLLPVIGAVLLCACLGKFVACSAAARFSGEPLREALGIGCLMNARGLMELILLNIALEHGIITNGMFTVMALMAVLTTLMATPLFGVCLGTRQFASSDPLPQVGVPGIQIAKPQE